MCECCARVNLLMVLHDRENGVDGAQKSKGNDRLVLVLLVFLALKNPGKDLCLPNAQAEYTASLFWWFRSLAFSFFLPTVSPTRFRVMSTAMTATSSLYSQIIFWMTLVKSSFSVSLTTWSSCCMTGRMCGLMYSFATRADTKKNEIQTPPKWLVSLHPAYVPSSWLLTNICKAMAASTLTGISLSSTRSFFTNSTAFLNANALWKRSWLKQWRTQHDWQKQRKHKMVSTTLPDTGFIPQSAPVPLVYKAKRILNIPIRLDNSLNVCFAYPGSQVTQPRVEQWEDVVLQHQLHLLHVNALLRNMRQSPKKRDECREKVFIQWSSNPCQKKWWCEDFLFGHLQMKANLHIARTLSSSSARGMLLRECQVMSQSPLKN